MGVTVTKPQNVVSPKGNAVSLYKDASSGKYCTKDINGKIENFYPQGFGYDSTDVPFKITATSGGNQVYGATNDVVEITFVGVNGDFTLYLPLATNYPYRIIRIVNDQTVGASTRILVTTQGGETIDGNANYVISKAFNGIQVWSDGTQWIVIQAKG